MLLLMSNQDHDRSVIFLHGWCGHPEEVSHIREAFPGPVLSPGWMPSPGSLDLEKWDPDRAAALMRSFADSILDQVARTIVDAGFAGGTLVGHSMGGVMACMLARRPDIDARQVILIDASVPLSEERRDGYIEKMGGWITKAASQQRMLTQVGWIAECPEWVPDFFSPLNEGVYREFLERRFLFNPVPEAAATIGGAVQWPVNEALDALECPFQAIAGDPPRMSVEAMKKACPRAEIATCPDGGHYPHIFKANDVKNHLREWLEKPVS